METKACLQLYFNDKTQICCKNVVQEDKMCLYFFYIRCRNLIVNLDNVLTARDAIKNVCQNLQFKKWSLDKLSKSVHALC